MFQYNMKARILQYYFKKILVICLLVNKNLPSNFNRLKKNIPFEFEKTKSFEVYFNYKKNKQLVKRIFVWKFRYQQIIKTKRHSAAKIHHSLIILCLKRKLKTKMVIYRNNVIKYK